MLNIGLYTFYDENIFNYKRNGLLLFLYQIYMLFIQIIMLNLIIAVMSESHHRVSEQSDLVALYQRATLILEHENAKVAKIASLRASAKAIPGKIDDALVRYMTDKAMHELGCVCPRWLHVLMPAEHQRDDGGVQAEELKQLREMRLEVSAMGESLDKKQSKLLDLIDKKAEREQLVRAVAVEIGKLREGLVDDIRGKVVLQNK